MNCNKFFSNLSGWSCVWDSSMSCGCSFCDYGLISYNYLSYVVLKARLSMIITSPYIFFIILFAFSTKVAGNIFLSIFKWKKLKFRGVKSVSSHKKANHCTTPISTYRLLTFTRHRKFLTKADSLGKYSSQNNLHQFRMELYGSSSLEEFLVLGDHK